MRRRKRKKQRKITILILITSLLILTTGYAAFNTNININVKGNIKKIIAAKQLKNKVVTQGDGLYQDTYEENRYIYKGTNPDNYITFNQETWRIISIEPDNTIKIIKKDSIGKKKWDETNSNNWTRTATINTYLNVTYYNSLLEQDKNQIETYNFPVGSIKYNNNNLVEQLESEAKQLWNGNIGLISVSDYIKANTNTIQCGNYKLHYDNKDICKTTNFLTPENNYYWTITPDVNSKQIIFRIHNNG